MIETRLSQEVVTEAEVERRIGDGQQHVKPARGSASENVVKDRKQRVEEKENTQEEDSSPEFLSAEELVCPTERKQHRSRQRQKVETAPTLEVSDGEHAGVEQRNVGE